MYCPLKELFNQLYNNYRRTSRTKRAVLGDNKSINWKLLLFLIEFVMFVYHLLLRLGKQDGNEWPEREKETRWSSSTRGMTRPNLEISLEKKHLHYSNCYRLTCPNFYENKSSEQYAACCLITAIALCTLSHVKSKNKL